MLRRTLLPLLVLGSFGLVAFGSAYANVPSPARVKRPPTPPQVLDPWRRPPVQAQFQVELVDDSLNSLQMFLHNGRKYVMGTMGQRYRIRVSNPTSSRVEAVVSVDGLDAIDGQAASLSKRGYVVPAFGSVTIDGFRTSMNSVAAFRFSSVSDSYAGRTGQDRNVGVIGVAIFRERAPVEIVTPFPSPPPKKRSTAAEASRDKSAAPNGAAPRAAQERPGLGTQFGEQQESRVRQTTFIRDSEQPMSTIELRYNDREGLRALGINIPPQPVQIQDDIGMRESADPFPGDRRFAQPPP